MPRRINGTSASDNLHGNNLEDEIYGYDGWDHIWGYGGSDWLYGGAGNDWLYGGSGVDYLYGGDHNDYLDGGSEADHLRGGAGNDIYLVENAGDRVYEYWDQGFDTVHSYLNSYTIDADAEIEVLNLTGAGTITGNGNRYDNRINGNGNGNTLRGEGGNDQLYGGAGIDTLWGGEGHDHLDGGIGADIMRGGGGSDSFTVDHVDDLVYEDAGVLSGREDLVYSYIPYSLAGTFLENLTLMGTAAIDGTGNEQDNTIIGNSAANVLRGGGGVDYIDGMGGADTMHGGIGDDRYFVDHAGDTEVEAPGGADPAAPGGGFDVVYATVSHTIGANVERLELMDEGGAIDGTGNDDDNHVAGRPDNIIHGNAFANTLSGRSGHDLLEGQGGVDHLYGGTGRDTLYGGAEGDFLYGEAGTDELDGGEGADTMTGGADNDNYHVGDAGDVVVELAGGGDDDFVYSTVSITADHIEHFYLLEAGGAINATGRGDANMMLVGNSFANRLEGGSFEDHFDGGGGGDTMIGRGGDDTYVIDNMGDDVIEAGGEGDDTVDTTVDHVLDENVENLWMQDAGGAIDGTGNSGDNDMRGNIHANVLDGRGGVDYMAGGAGNDTYYVDNTGDRIHETLATDGTDRVYASASFTLGFWVDNLTLLDGFGALDGTGSGYANTLTGNSSNNVLRGEAGNDTLRGNGGDDTLIGGFGRDTLDGGYGADTFKFVGTGGTSDTTLAEPDQILDFVSAENDKIDLSMMYTGTLDPFSFIGAAAFTPGVAGEIRYAGGFLEGNTDWDVAAEFRIVVGVGSLAESDFILS
jgi:trimeric autotransporter adhesin